MNILLTAIAAKQECFSLFTRAFVPEAKATAFATTAFLTETSFFATEENLFAT